MARFVAVAAALVVAAAVFAASQAEAEVTCGQVATNLRSCIPYVTGRVNVMPSGCCDGVRTLNSAARSTADRRTTCNCIRSQAARINGIQTGRLSGIPSNCGVQVPYPISASTDCSRVT